MTIQAESTVHTRRLRYLGYANVAFGILSFVGWALPGPQTVQHFWAILDGSGAASGDPIFTFFAGVMKAGVVLVVAVFWLTSLVALANGYFILRRRRYRVCLILSGVSVIGTLFGVLLGIVSLVVLTRDWARAQFSDAVQVGNQGVTAPESPSGACDDG
jgi:hypothetical protein